MDLGLAGKAAIVNGASQGIGYAIAHLLAEEGARVAVTARRTPALDRAAELIRNETDAEVIAVQGDVRNPADCERIVTEAVAGSVGSTSLSTMTALHRWARPLTSTIRYG
jgi:3-oxoacyl-[acyl-carrier protein] reductase